MDFVQHQTQLAVSYAISVLFVRAVFKNSGLWAFPTFQPLLTDAAIAFPT